jgi:hypothetical protein
LILHALTDPIAQENLSRQLHPTIVVATNQNINLISQTIMGWRRESTMSSIKITLNQRKLASGRLPKGLKHIRAQISNELRLIYISVQPDTRPVVSYNLDFLRAGLGSHVIYAIGSPWAFGPVAQTHIHDYRVDTGQLSGLGHFGAPVGAAEIKLTEVDDEGSVHGKVGTLQIAGPIVAKTGWVNTGLKAKWRKDGCLEVQF